MVWYPIIVSFRWLGILVETMGHLLTLVTTILILVMSNNIDAGMAGLAIAYAVKISNSLTFFIRSASDLENSLISVERIDEYTKIEPEVSFFII